MKKAKAPRAGSELETRFLLAWRAVLEAPPWRLRAVGMGHAVPVREYKFHATRNWRFDFAWPEARVAVEIEGGVWKGGRHTRGAGFIGDCEKYNAAVLDGWRVFRLTGEMIDTAHIAPIARLICG